MFESIGNFIEFALNAAMVIFWIIAGLACIFGLWGCIYNLFKGSGWEKFWSLLAIVLAVFAFIRVYDWLESIFWCMLVSGIVLCSVGLPHDGSESRRKRDPGPSVGDVIITEMVQYQRDKEVVKNALREWEEGR